MSYLKKNIIIIGAGPAALSMSSTLLMANVDHIILEKSEKPGGQLTEIHNEPEDFIIGLYKNGLELTKKINNFSNKYQFPIKFHSKVTGIDIHTKTINYIYRGIEKHINYDYVIIATGSRFNIDKKSIDRRFSKDIYYRISYNLNDFSNKKVAVIGNGDNATIAALRLIDYASEIYLVNKSDRWKSRKDLVDNVINHPKIIVLNHKILIELNGDTNLKSIEIKDINTGDKNSIKIDKIVFKIGYLPNSEFIPQEIDMDEKGYIKVTERYKTSAPNIFAIGDIVSSAYKRISIALGHGTELGNFFLKELLE